MSEALEILKSCDAFLEGHFLLSSGRHSSAYCQMAYLQQYPDRCAEVMKAVADKVKEMDVDVIVGPAMGGKSENMLSSAMSVGVLLKRKVPSGLIRPYWCFPPYYCCRAGRACVWP